MPKIIAPSSEGARDGKGAQVNTIPEITVFGDSHSSFFFPAPFFAGRCGYGFPLPYRVTGKAIHAASLAGFRPGVSTLKVKETIAEALPSARHMVLAFGQVDLELGYYYRLAVKKENTNPADYVDWLLGIYRSFLGALDTGHCRMALKGVNLTALSPKLFAVRYVSRIVMEGRKIAQATADEMILPHILPEIEQNRMHRAFNRKLADLARDLGHGYFDLNDQISDGPIQALAAAQPRLGDHFKTGFFDHHLADTVVVRRMHYEALGKVFGLL